MNVLNYSTTRFILFTHSYAGAYIKEIAQTSTDRKQLVLRLSRILVFDPWPMTCFLFHHSCTRKFSVRKLTNQKDREKLLIYVKIEKELRLLIQEKQAKDNEISYDYERAVLAPAIERVTGNSLTKITDDGEFEAKLNELQSKYNRYYY